MNFPQSSRVAGNLNSKIFPEAQVASISKPAYLAEKFYKSSGDTDVKITKKEDAKPQHYLLWAAAIVGVVLYASHKLG